MGELGFKLRGRHLHKGDNTMSTAQVMWWHRDDGGHTAILLGAGNKYLQVIVLDGTV